MSRIKFIRPAALLLSFILAFSVITPAAGADSGFRPDDEDLYFSALNEEIKEDVRTIEVTRGDFTVMSSCKGEIVYDNVSYCFNTLQEGSVKYVKMLVSSGDWVQRGDRIMQVSTTVENADLEGLRAQIEVEEQKTLDETMELLTAMKAGNLYFKRVKVSDFLIRVNIYDKLICKGTPADVMENIENGNLEKILYDLTEKKITKGTIVVGHDQYCSFSPEID